MEEHPTTSWLEAGSGAEIRSTALRASTRQTRTNPRVNRQPERHQRLVNSSKLSPEPSDDPLAICKPTGVAFEAFDNG